MGEGEALAAGLFRWALGLLGALDWVYSMRGLLVPCAPRILSLREESITKTRPFEHVCSPSATVHN